MCKFAESHEQVLNIGLVGLNEGRDGRLAGMVGYNVCLIWQIY